MKRFCLALLVLILVQLSYAQQVDSLTIKHRLKDKYRSFKTGDSIKCLLTDLAPQVVRGTITGVDTANLYLGSTEVPFKHIRKIIPQSGPTRKMRVITTAGLITGSALLLTYQPPFASAGFLMVPASAILRDRTQFSLQSRWRIQLPDSTLLEPKPIEQDTTWRKLSSLEKFPFSQAPAFQIKTSVLQFINKEYNLAVEHRLGNRGAIELGGGIVHTNILGVLSNGFYLENPATYSEGYSARLAYKYYPASRYKEVAYYLAGEVKYRQQEAVDQFYEESADPEAQAFGFSHSREETHVQLGFGAVSTNSPLLLEVVFGGGVSFQNRDTEYGPCTNCFTDDGFPSESDRFALDDGYYVLPRLHLGVIAGLAFQRKHKN